MPVSATSYTKGDYNSLPTNGNDLKTAYTPDELARVVKQDFLYSSQTGALAYMIHEFKTNIGTQTFCEIEWEGKSTLAPMLSAVMLQVFNQVTQLWETLNVENEAPDEVNFQLEGKVPDTTNYKDVDSIITARIYQLAI